MCTASILSPMGAIHVFSPTNRSTGDVPGQPPQWINPLNLASVSLYLSNSPSFLSKPIKQRWQPRHVSSLMFLQLNTATFIRLPPFIMGGYRLETSKSSGQHWRDPHRLFPATTTGACATGLAWGGSATSGVSRSRKVLFGTPGKRGGSGKEFLQVLGATGRAFGLVTRADNKDLAAFSAIQTEVIKQRHNYPPWGPWSFLPS